MQIPRDYCVSTGWKMKGARIAVKYTSMDVAASKPPGNRGGKKKLELCPSSVCQRSKCFPLLPGSVRRDGRKQSTSVWVVKVALDAWLATAGLRGGASTGDVLLYLSASHPLLPSASADPQGPVRRDGLSSVVVSPCYAASGGAKMYLVISSPTHREVSLFVSRTVASRRPFSPAVAAAALGPPFDVAASQRPDVAAPVICTATSSLHLSGPDALGPTVSLST